MYVNMYVRTYILLFICARSPTSYVVCPVHSSWRSWRCVILGVTQAILVESRPNLPLTECGSALSPFGRGALPSPDSVAAGPLLVGSKSATDGEGNAPACLSEVTDRLTASVP